MRPDFCTIKDFFKYLHKRTELQLPNYVWYKEIYMYLNKGNFSKYAVRVGFAYEKRDYIQYSMAVI